jgi:5-methylcytosine-specific restriction endonuclease McrA
VSRLRACIECGRPARGTRCTVHAKVAERRRGSPTARGYGRDYQALRRQVLAEEQACWLCGYPARVGDPLTVDHVLPLALGGVNHQDERARCPFELQLEARRSD